MQSQGDLSQLGFQEKIKRFASTKWENLDERQKNYAKKAWSVITYKWRWQIAMNIPYVVIFCLDRTFPSVHEFDVALLAAITAKLPIPSFLSSLMGLS